MLLNVKLPMTNKYFYSFTDRGEIKKKVSQIMARYGNEINTCAKLTNVPKELILAFIFIESGGDVNAKSGAGAIGLMQLIPASASDIIFIENQKKRLTAAESAVISAKLGNRFTQGILKMRYLGDKVKMGNTTQSVFITAQDLYDPMLNILCGSIYLGLLIDEHNESGAVRLDKVVLRYNRGYFSENKGKNFIGTIADLILNIPNESKSYVLKLVGKNGVLESMFS